MTRPLLIALFLLNTIVLFGQQVAPEVRQRHLGEVIFMNAPVPVDQFNETHILTTAQWSEHTNLYIRTFLKRPLADELRSLAPQMSEEALLANGNFHFTFVVDEIVIYQESLHPGAFGSGNKKNALSFSVPLQSDRKEDSWGRFLFRRFLASGGEDALTGGNHALRIEVRSYVRGVDHQSDLLGAGAIILQSRKTWKPVSPSQAKPSIIRPAADWEIGHPDWIDSAIRKLRVSILQGRLREVTSVVVIHRGKLVAEEYFQHARRTTLHNTRSVTKTITALVMGQAIRDGYIKSVNDSLGLFYPLRDDRIKSGITLHQLLSMSSSFDANDEDPASPGNEENMYPKPNWVQWALGLPTKSDATTWSYFTGGVVLLGDVLHQKVPAGLESYAGRQLFEPLKIRKYEWQYTPQHVANTAGGLKLTSLDLARLGQLLLDSGRFQQMQLIPKDWVRLMLTPHQGLPDGRGHYGYLVWQQNYQIERGDYTSWYLSGNGGNRVHIFPSLDLVVVITAQAFNQPYMHRQADAILKQYLLPAMKGR